MKINPLEAAAASKNKSKDIHLPSIDVSFGSNRILCARFRMCLPQFVKPFLDPARPSHSRTVVGTVSSVETVSESLHFSVTSPCVKFPFPRTLLSSSSNKK